MTPKLTEKEMDQSIVSQAEDDLAWGKPVKVRRGKPTSLVLPAELALRAAFPRPVPAQDKKWLPKRGDLQN